MLGPIRKFSTSIYSKILLGIIIIPFVFWGMGSSFVSGNKNVIVVINKEKYSIQEFSNFIQKFASNQKEIKANQIEELLYGFIGEKLLEKEIERLNIKLSDNSLSKLIKHQKDFKREGNFSRIEYEKFLVENNITASNFESNLSKHEKKKQLLDFIGGGVMPSKFLVNKLYDKINQKRNIELINLNNVFKKKLNFSDKQIKSYFENNKDKYKEVYKSLKLLELTPKRLVGSDEFNNLFFKKIDEIDDIIVQGENIEFIIVKFNLQKANLFTLNKFGEDEDAKKVNNLPESLIKNIFDIDDSDPIALIENNDKYFIVEIIKTDEIQRKIQDQSLMKEILFNLKKEAKRKMIAEIINKINNNNFVRSDFHKLSKNENVTINKIKLENINDDKILKKELIDQIYTFSEKKVVVIHDLSFSENFLIYIDNIENVKIGESSETYKKYLNLYKIKTTSELYNTYDLYIKNIYKIDINYQTLNTVKNNFIN